jgi:hypothetical protein
MKSIEDEFTSFEPKMKNRFKVTISEPWKIPTYVVKRITLPKLNINDGKYDDIHIELYDEIHNSTSNSIFATLREHMNVETTLTIHLLGPVGDTIGEYIIVGKFKSFDTGELNYEMAEPITINAIFRVTKCISNY